MNLNITPKQKKLLEFIHYFTLDHGYAPSQREIANHFGWKSLGTVQDYLRKLVDKKLLKKVWNARRALEVSDEFLETLGRPRKASAVDLLGRIAAGRPIEAVSTSEEALTVPDEMLGSGNYYALEVKGNSMIEDGILSGDFVIVKQQQDAEEGQTVIALINNNATLKRFYRRGKKVELRPANREMDPIIVSARKVKVQGIVSGLFRKY